MRSLMNKIVKSSLKKYTNQNYVRLISNTIIHGPEHDSNEKKENIIIRKITELNEWYIKFTGLDEIKRLQDRVIITQEKLEKAQEERRQIGKLLVDVRKKSVDLQEQLHNTKRWENTQRFLDLTRQETEVMKEEKELSAKFEVLDKGEREIFTALSNAVRDSHEKEKAQSEYTKYWGIILSIFGTIVGAVVSTIISTIRNHQIVSGINQGVEEKFNQMAGIIKEDGKSTVNIQTMVAEIKNDNYKTSKIIVDRLHESQKQLSELIKNTSARNLLAADKIKNGDKMINVDSFLSAQTYMLQQHQNEIKRILAEIYLTPDLTMVSETGGPNWRLIGGLLLLGLILGKIF